MKQDQRGKVLELLKRSIPRSPNGDPGFETLASETEDADTARLGFESFAKHSLLSVFTPEEIVVLCNRALYQADYQRTWHRQWERRKAEELAPLKEKVVDMFKLRRWTDATEEQLRKAKEALEKK